MKNYNFHLYFHTIWGARWQRNVMWFANLLNLYEKDGWSEGRKIIRIPIDQPVKYWLFKRFFWLQVRYRLLVHSKEIYQYRPLIDVYKGSRKHKNLQKPLFETGVLWLLNLLLVRPMCSLALFVWRKIQKSS